MLPEAALAEHRDGCRVRQSQQQSGSDCSAVPEIHLLPCGDSLRPCGGRSVRTFLWAQTSCPESLCRKTDCRRSVAREDTHNWSQNHETPSSRLHPPPLGGGSCRLQLAKLKLISRGVTPGQQGAQWLGWAGSPAAVAEQQEENAEDDAGGADVDANDDAAEGGLSVPALAQAPPLWRHSTAHQVNMTSPSSATAARSPHRTLRSI